MPRSVHPESASDPLSLKLGLDRRPFDSLYSQDRSFSLCRGRDTPAARLEKERAGLVLSPIRQKVSRLFYPLLLFSVRRANSTTLATVHNVPARARPPGMVVGVWIIKWTKTRSSHPSLSGGTLLSLSRALFWGSVDSRARSPFSVHESPPLVPWTMPFSQIARSHCRPQSDMLRLSRRHQNAAADQAGRGRRSNGRKNNRRPSIKRCSPACSSPQEKLAHI